VGRILLDTSRGYESRLWAGLQDWEVGTWFALFMRLTDKATSKINRRVKQADYLGGGGNRCNRLPKSWGRSSRRFGGSRLVLVIRLPLGLRVSGRVEEGTAAAFHHLTPFSTGDRL
jgi:hypothetical protein